MRQAQIFFFLFLYNWNVLCILERNTTIGSSLSLLVKQKKLDPSLGVQAGDSYITLLQKKALARFQEMS